MYARARATLVYMYFVFSYIPTWSSGAEVRALHMRMRWVLYMHCMYCTCMHTCTYCTCMHTCTYCTCMHTCTYCTCMGTWVPSSSSNGPTCEYAHNIFGNSLNPTERIQRLRGVCALKYTQLETWSHGQRQIVQPKTRKSCFWALHAGCYNMWLKIKEVVCGQRLIDVLQQSHVAHWVSYHKHSNVLLSCNVLSHGAIMVRSVK